MPTTRYIDLPSPSLGTQRTLQVVCYGQRGARPKVYMQTGLHADENPGMLVMHHLKEALDKLERENAIEGEIVLVPVANPIGLNQRQHGDLLGRFESDSGENFNRNFPDFCEDLCSRIDGKLTQSAEENVELIRAELKQLADKEKSSNELQGLRNHLVRLAISSDICLDLHCDWEAVMHVYTGSTLWPEALDLCAWLGAEAVMLANISGGNPFDECMSAPWWLLQQRYPKLPIPAACLAATVELRGERDVNDGLARRDAEALLNFLSGRGVIAGETQATPESLCDATPLEGVDRIIAPSAGVVVYKKRPGDKVSQGEIVASIVDPLSRGAASRIDLKSSVDGVMYARRGDRMARPGQSICSIAGSQPIEGKAGKLLSD